MVINKRSKNSRQRGGWTHGWGSKKKHRGAGHRGGRGMAGTGKRGDVKKTLIWKNKKYFGKFGFKKKGVAEKIIAINLVDIERNVDSWIAKKLVNDEKGTYSIEAEKIGFNKVLGTGKLTKKLKISCPYFSKSAVEKIKAAGGEVIQPNPPVQEAPTSEQKEE